MAYSLIYFEMLRDYDVDNSLSDVIYNNTERWL